jgi:phosphopantetheinyl transferase (holo-ACP synthase)
MYVGNDIVAYKHQRCMGKWRNELFLKKILSDTELEILQEQTNKDAYLWSLWTLKEAAYKLSCFLGNRNKFHAKQFTVSALRFTDDDIQTLSLPADQTSLPSHCIPSRIAYQSQEYYGISLITHQFIHSMVFDEAVQHTSLLFGIAEHKNYDKDDYSKEVRSFAKQCLLNQHIDYLDIEKDENGIPYLITNNNQANYISLSHDQQFVSFAIIRNR